MGRLLRSLRPFIVNLLLVGLCMVGGIVLDRQVLVAFVPPSTIPASARADFQWMAQAWNVIERVYVDRTAGQPRRLTYTGPPPYCSVQSGHYGRPPAGAEADTAAGIAQGDSGPA